MQESFITYRVSTIHYTRFGNGHDIIIALHGFNESGKTFQVLDLSPQRYSIIAIDLPYHGKTDWHEGLRFTPDDLHTIIQYILKNENLSNKTYCIMGYSMGGRLALSYYEHYPSFIHSVKLLAPDGLTVNFWYYIASQTRIGNNIFKAIIERPAFFLQFVHLLHRLKMISASLPKFIDKQFEARNISSQVYNVWTSFRLFKPDKKNICTLLKQQPVPFTLYFGKFDNIIPIKNAQYFIKHILDHVHLVLLDTGHHLLKPAFAYDILIAP